MNKRGQTIETNPDISNNSNYNQNNDNNKSNTSNSIFDKILNTKNMIIAIIVVILIIFSIIAITIDYRQRNFDNDKNKNITQPIVENNKPPENKPKAPVNLTLNSTNRPVPPTPVRRGGGSSSNSNSNTNTCTPLCTNKTCGDDGCGGNTCGTCGTGTICINFNCQAINDYSYPIFSNYYDNNGTLLSGQTARFNVSVDNTNGTVFINIDGIDFPATNYQTNKFSYSIISSNGTHQYYWWSYGTGVNQNYNRSENKMLSVGVNNDNIYPLFYNIKDNTNVLEETGVARFNCSVNNTNLTVFLRYNNQNYAPSRSGNFYNITIAVNSPSNYSYYWFSYGNGTNKNYNQSSTKYYNIKSDLNYPIFSNYWDNTPINISMFAKFNVTVKGTNGTVFLEINGQNYISKNLSLNLYNVSVNRTNPGTFNYRWIAYGNGTRHKLNVTTLRTFDVINPSLTNRTFYVSPTGNDNNPGTSASPWLTIQEFGNHAQAGDTLIVRAGTYSGFVFGWDGPNEGVYSKIDGTNSSPITIHAEPGVLINHRNGKTPDGIDLENCDHIIIEGFTINNADSTITRAGIRVAGGGIGNIVRNNNVSNCGTWAIFSSYTTDLLVENNSASNSGSEHGIYTSNSPVRPIIRNNRVFGNSANGLHFNGDVSMCTNGVPEPGCSGMVENAIIENNIIYDNGRNGGSAINCDGCRNSLIKNNLVYNTHASGISLYDIDATTGATNNTVVNNIILLASDSDRWALNINSNSYGNKVFNNIFYSNGNKGSIRVDDDGSLTGFESNYNILESCFTTNDASNCEFNINQWKAFGYDRNSSTIDSSGLTNLFFNITNNDYHPKSGSIAIDNGTNIFAGRNAPTKDIENNFRPQGTSIDIGSYEYSGDVNTGREPVTFWTAELRATWQHMVAQNHPYWQMVKDNAERTGTANERYNDIGQWCTLMYGITGNVSYARKVIARAIPPDVTWGSNQVRAEFMTRAWMFDWLYSAMTPQERTDYINELYSWADLALNKDLSMGYFTRLYDSDNSVGNYFGIAMLSIVTKELDPRANNLMNETIDDGYFTYNVGGFTSTGANFNTWRNAISEYVERAKGGIWIESFNYNMETVQLLLNGVQGINTATGTDNFPEVTQYAKDLALIYPHLYTPGSLSTGIAADAAQWGDEEHPHDVESRWFDHITTAGMLAGYTKNDPNVGPYINKWIDDVNNKYGYSGYMSAEPVIVGYLLFLMGYDPNAAKTNWKNLPLTADSSGMGFTYYRSSWNDDATYLVVHANNPPGVDHQVSYTMDERVYRNGEWVLDRPLGYAIQNQLAANGILVEGFGIMGEATGRIGEEVGVNNSYIYVAETTGGNSMWNDYYNPPATFDHETTQKLFFLPGNTNDPDIMVRYDRINAVPSTDLSHYYAEDRARIQNYPTKLLIYHTPTLANINGNIINWQTTNGQYVKIQVLSTNNLLFSALQDTMSTYSGSIFDSELKYHVRIIPATEKQWDTFISIADFSDSNVANTNTRIVSNSGEAEGVLIARTNRNNRIVMFNSKQGMNVTFNAGTGRLQYDPNLLQKLAGQQIHNSGFTFNFTSTTPSTNVYLVDLNSSKQWYANIDGTNQQISVSSQGIGSFVVSGIGSHIIVMNTIQGCIDNDLDHYNQSATGCGVLDCNDSNASINPGAIEICGNSIDEDCNGGDLICGGSLDLDRDYFISGSSDYDSFGYICGPNQNEQCLGNNDCDSDTNRNAGVIEICNNGIDDDCNGVQNEGCSISTTHPIIPLGYVDMTSPEYFRFKDFVDLQLSGSDWYAFSATDAITMYKLTGNVNYGNYAINMVDQYITAGENAIASGNRPKIVEDSYLEVGPNMRDIALTYDWGYNLLTPLQRSRWMNFSGKVIWNLWNCNDYNDLCNSDSKWSWTGWSIDNPGNNYYYSFLEATMYYSIVTNNQTWINFLKTQKYPQLVNYFKGMSGGGSREGTGYGTAFASLFEDYRLWKDVTGEDLSIKTRSCRDTIDYWILATVPTQNRIPPIGDHARDSEAWLFDYQRHLILEAVYLNRNKPDANRGEWWLSRTIIDQDQIGRMRHTFDFIDDLLKINLAEVAPTKLIHHSKSTGHLFARSSWNSDATWISFNAGPYAESHAHMDQGDFNLYKNSWLIVDENIYSHSGIEQDVINHNLVRFVRGSTTINQDSDEELMHKSSLSYTDSNGILKINANLTEAYYANINVRYWYRNLTFDKNNEALLIEDRFNITSGTTAVWQIHTPSQPVQQGDGTIKAGNLTIIPIYPASPQISIVNGQFGGWRVELSGSNSKYVVQLNINPASGAPLIQGGPISGAMVAPETKENDLNTLQFNRIIKNIINYINDFMTTGKIE